MKTYADQEFLTDAEADVVGDCWRACVANLVGEPREAVPHFVQQYGDHWDGETNKWLRQHFDCELARGPAEFPVTEARFGYVILIGRSPRGDYGHAVLADLHGETVHDPHPSRAGLQSITGMFRATKAGVTW